MLSGCVTPKILHNGDQHGKEKRSIISWYPDRIAEDNEAMLNSPLSLDVEQVRRMCSAWLNSNPMTRAL